MGKERLKNLDYVIFIPYIIMSVIGVVMVYSASANIALQNGGSPLSYLIKQLIYMVVGLGIILFMIRMNINFLRKPIVLKFLLGLFVFGLLWLLVFGKTINGAAGWIHLGPINIQPAEFVKFFLIIWLANAVASGQPEMTLSVRSWLDQMKWPLFWSLALIALIFKQPDSGGAAINFAIVFILINCSGFSWKRALSIIYGCAAGAFLIFELVLVPMAKSDSFSNSYRLQRIVAFTNPFGHAQGTGQQVVNSYYAISNGGLFGVGLGNSVQKTGYLPEPNTDFIMSILTEELGAIAAFLVLALLTVIILRTIQIGVRSNDPYQSLICYGVATYMSIQTFFNMGGVLGVLPITGVTFPFISYGGSSILTLAMCLGLVLNISSRQRIERRALKLARKAH
ncbi:FtsW/RodA/SpoVE family cell cycle protein [Lentilactobacillus kefiri]|uniref:Probable peptidoglycan glycosyltransferase FtsW n=2 Tax=Lentilactobacillus kefiri TaxID=33962 RepID=A0A8E1RJE4_LENKE|nr:FtsW/RodA/SpoVE family cell cycle protein [Lentilactobacillus kefiri]KRL57635.1 cell cycle protein [Lentilactobacillus parakefiri DSM 10551]KRM52200.1 cell cycle protein [Lentilactobacillus kefiri DSM 20587 = JCM 5818]MCJ2161229.1 FtsW/RodA/SpoVE family cell cycle protein [Lentilactobacillus kefiri]MCP9368239.1 FtsW/RodA/SpoVE family cell cycle protein [Lentilactobacillus kefiri]MDH5108147.1 FtsW/RodA/SpoVE family cell cycle protein [Lentilactobacillus kefiri]